MRKSLGERNMQQQADTRGIPDPCPICGGPALRSRSVVRAGRVALCGDCGSWYRVPRPTSEDLRGIYEKQYYDSWGLDENGSIARVTKRATFVPVLRRLGKVLGTKHAPGMRILDVGAATGLLLELAAEMAWQPYAVEVNPYAAEQLRRRFGADRTFHGELTACPFDRKSFHAIAMTDLIEHVLDVKGTLRTARGLLRPGGALCMTTPRVDSTSRRLMGANWLHFKAEHVQYFSRRGMAIALQSAGFDDIRVSPSPKYLTFDYLCLQLRSYPHRLLSPLAGAMQRLIPVSLRRRPLPYLCGEMLVIARAR